MRKRDVDCVRDIIPRGVTVGKGLIIVAGMVITKESLI